MQGIDIPGYDGKYTVFPNGTVRRNPSKYRRTTMMLKPKPGRYLRVALYGSGGRKELSIHRLVAMCFIPNKHNLPWVNHIDGDTHNNHVENLEWVTPTENELHSIRILGRNRNTDVQRRAARACGMSKRKLTMEQAAEVRSKSNKVSRKELASEYDVSLSVIDNIVTNKRYVER